VMATLSCAATPPKAPEQLGSSRTIPLDGHLTLRRAADRTYARAALRPLGGPPLRYAISRLYPGLRLQPGLLLQWSVYGGSYQIIHGLNVGSMGADKILTVMAVAVATAAMALAATPSEAQAPPPAPRHHAPIRVTVHKRPNADPIAENRRRAEYYHLFPQEYGMSPRRDSTLFMNGPSLPFIHDRMPFPTCLDLPGFCRAP
jgi:hypothetical protein